MLQDLQIIMLKCIELHLVFTIENQCQDAYLQAINLLLHHLYLYTRNKIKGWNISQLKEHTHDTCFKSVTNQKLQPFADDVCSVDL